MQYLLDEAEYKTYRDLEKEAHEMNKEIENLKDKVSKLKDKKRELEEIKKLLYSSIRIDLKNKFIGLTPFTIKIRGDEIEKATISKEKIIDIVLKYSGVGDIYNLKQVSDKLIFKE